MLFFNSKQRRRFLRISSQILPRNQEAPRDKSTHVPLEPALECSGLAFRVIAMVPAEVWPTVRRPEVRCCKQFYSQECRNVFKPITSAFCLKHSTRTCSLKSLVVCREKNNGRHQNFWRPCVPCPLDVYCSAFPPSNTSNGSKTLLGAALSNSIK